MSIRVRIKNFQSIKDADLKIDGFTVITGTNNSGKTAVMRAIRGVFTNPPAEALLRHGEAYLSVELTFSDGTNILWEKGWEKPDQKGGRVNRYVINGTTEVKMAGVGVPAEVKALGVYPISAGTDSVWPQIASQFDGNLFLVNKPGAATAEALSDVEKVGKLTSALKLSERDRRQLESELKVRRKDRIAAEADLAKFDGFEDLENLDLKGLRGRVVQASETAAELASTLTRLNDAKAQVARFKGSETISVPSLAEIKARREALRTSRTLQEKWGDASKRWERYRDFDVQAPDSSNVVEAASTARSLRSLSARREAAREVVQRLAGAPTSTGFSAPDRARKIAELISALKKLKRSHTSALADVNRLDLEAKTLQAQHEALSTEVAGLLTSLGKCPMCGSAQHLGGIHEDR